MTSITPKRISIIPRPGCVEASITIHSTPTPKTIVEFLTLCLEKYEQVYRGFLMIIFYDPKDLVTENETRSIMINMGKIIEEANNLFLRKLLNLENPRKNLDSIPRLRINREFMSKNGIIVSQELVFTIQTEYRYEPDFNEVVDGKYADGTYFMTPNFTVR